MAVQYNRLWKWLMDVGIKESVLPDIAAVSASEIIKPGQGEYVSLEILERVCRAFHCAAGRAVKLTREAGAR